MVGRRWAAATLAVGFLGLSTSVAMSKPLEKGWVRYECPYVQTVNNPFSGENDTSSGTMNLIVDQKDNTLMPAGYLPLWGKTLMIPDEWNKTTLSAGIYSFPSPPGGRTNTVGQWKFDSRALTLNFDARYVWGYGSLGAIPNIVKLKGVCVQRFNMDNIPGL